MKNYKSIIIGGAGFIGSALCKSLWEKGESVLSLSRSAKSDFVCDQEVCDVDDVIALKKNLAGAENVFILVGQIYGGFDEIAEIKNLKNIIDSVDNCSTKKVFYFSSVLVYGETGSPAEEDYTPKPIEQYSGFKLKAERIISSVEKRNWIFIALRLSNVYGNPQNKGFIGFILEKFFEKKKCRFSVNGDGRQTRDYIFIDDVIEAVMNIKDKAKNDDIINICTGTSHSLIELVAEIEAKADHGLTYEILHNQIPEVKNSFISNEKLKLVYNFTPRFDLKTGLQKTFENYKDFYKIT